MKLLSFQPFSLFQNGGGSRVLRRLYEGQESRVTSLAIDTSSSRVLSGNIPETIIKAIPVRKSWMRWHLRDIVEWIQMNLFWNFTIRKLSQTAKNIDHDVIHVVNHGKFSTALCNFSIKEKSPLWVSFHDHYLTCSSFEDAQLLWDLAERRFVISNELGNEYQKLFGYRIFEVITDGVYLDEVSAPKKAENQSIIIYFAGLMHWDYLPLIKVLADALDMLTFKGFKFKLVLRGAYQIKYLIGRSFDVEYRTDFISENEIKKELDEANILYLPIKFSDPNFYLYSLSTKMIQYLGAPGTILYHGPNNSVASNFLKRFNCAVCCESLEAESLVANIIVLLDKKDELSKNAKSVAVSQFNLKIIQNNFWMLNN